MAKTDPFHQKQPILANSQAITMDRTDVFADGSVAYHDNDACPVGQKIAPAERELGKGKDGAKRCPTCATLKE